MLSIVSYDESESENDDEDISVPSSLSITQSQRLPSADGKRKQQPSDTHWVIKDSKTAAEAKIEDDVPVVLPGVCFSASVSEMLSGLPPPKKKRVKASDSIFAASTDLSSLPKRLTSLTGQHKSRDGTADTDKDNNAYYSDDSDTETDNALQNKQPISHTNRSSDDSQPQLLFSNPLLCQYTLIYLYNQ